MSNETDTEPAIPSNTREEPVEHEEKIVEEAIRILRRTLFDDSMVALPWTGLQYRNEPDGRGLPA
ncbi:hypothetical protein [Arthrobacter sp. StoSoilB5]|jgi:hypothetical protein|uniref:hypothetical protein n=1 Tax=Arthrobacter sp. StoSoilB5 TaxID=2830992 RepID=UPI001CC5C64F|nr:hypothetical protein [Arthrobacter sp. StoSoilB5]BCW45156.1 hypothetical protein StoSoilB5_23400 [Arthrobacter sp. StoSoilB5]